jgi:hypothetical protein
LKAVALLVASIAVFACSRNDPAEATKSAAPATSANPSAAAQGPGSKQPEQTEPTEPAAPSSDLADAAIEEVPVAMPQPPPPPEARPDASGPAAVRAIFDGYGFPVVAYVEPLCARRIARGAGTFTWDAFVSELSPAELIAAFKKRLGDTGFSVRGQGGTWRLPAGSPAPRRTIVVSAPGEPGPHDTCQDKPARGARSVLLLTRDD